MILGTWKSCAWLASLLILATSGAAQVAISTQSTAPATNGDQTTVPRIPGLFEIDLPMIQRRGTIKFVFQPRFRDLLDKRYLRVPLEFRWAVNDHLELSSDIDDYFTHGLRNGSGYGFSSLHFGAKYIWREWLKPAWGTSVGFNSSIPVSRPPIEMTDGHNHFTPFIVFSRQLDWTPGLSCFLSGNVDLISKSDTPGNFGRNQPHSNSATFAPGLLYDHKAWHYTLEVDLTTTRLIGRDDHDFVTVRPGVIWDLPKKLVFNARGRWLAGFNLTFVFGPDGNTISTGSRFRGEVNVTRWFRRDRQDNGQPPDPPAAH